MGFVAGFAFGTVTMARESGNKDSGTNSAALGGDWSIDSHEQRGSLQGHDTRDEQHGRGLRRRAVCLAEQTLILTSK
jgi:hypothetical protein